MKSQTELQELWDQKAQDWDIQVGAQGDRNRQINSDPILWQYLAQVQSQKILDAGCGTGYFSRLLAQQGAQVTGVDLSPQMINIAKSKAPELDWRIHPLNNLASLEDQIFDTIVSNYVLMDLPDLEGSLLELARVLKSGGRMLLVVSHPCFPREYGHPEAQLANGDVPIRFQWPFGYLNRREVVEPAWHHFSSEFVWYHRPLSAYFEAFAQAQLHTIALEEPCGQLPETGTEEERLRIQKRNKTELGRPNSVLFVLLKA